MKHKYKMIMWAAAYLTPAVLAAASGEKPIGFYIAHSIVFPVWMTLLFFTTRPKPLTDHGEETR